MNLTLEYNKKLEIPQFTAATCKKTSQTESVLTVQNHSANLDVTFSLSPDPKGKGLYTIKANNYQPTYFQNNWNGDQLKISNISGEAVSLLVYLT